MTSEPPDRLLAPPNPAGEGEALARWLQRATPTGAPVLRIGPAVVPIVAAGPQIMGIRFDGLRPGDAPDTWGRGATPARARDRAIARSPAIADVLREYADVPEDYLGLLVDHLAPPPTRGDGLPSFHRPGLRQPPPSDLPFKKTGAGWVLRVLAAAVATDVRGMGQAQVADALGLRDHVEDDPEGELDPIYRPEGSRGVRRYLPAGRALLGELGAWPWSSFDAADKRKPPAAWWTDAQVLAALSVWHFESWLAAWFEARRSRGDGEFGPLTAAEHVEAVAEWEQAAENLSQREHGRPAPRWEWPTGPAPVPTTGPLAPVGRRTARGERDAA